MANVILQFRQGSTTNHSTFAGQAAELTVDSTKWTAVIHDGSTNGGHPLSKEGHTHVENDITDLKYKIVQIATTSQTARTNLNFSSFFAATDSSINDSTTISLANNNTSGAGTYGSATQVAQVHIDATGIITSVTNVTITGVVPGGSASGDLTGLYPGPTVASVGGKSSSTIATVCTTVSAATNSNTASTLVFRDSSGNFSAGTITASLTGNVTGNCSGTAGSFTGNLSGDVTSSGMTTTIATVNTNVGTWGSATQVPHITVNGKGQITAVSLVTISGVAPAGGAGGDLNGSYPNPGVLQVGGLGAASVASGATAANDATNNATGSLIAVRDAAGGCDFTYVGQTVQSVAFSATPTFDASLGSIIQFTWSGSVSASTIINMTPGQVIIFDIIHDATTSNYTFAWPTNLSGGNTPAATTANAHNRQAFYTDGSNLWSISSLRND